jgi:hypothetical protein
MFNNDLHSKFILRDFDKTYNYINAKTKNFSKITHFDFEWDGYLNCFCNKSPSTSDIYLFIAETKKDLLKEYSSNIKTSVFVSNSFLSMMENNNNIKEDLKILNTFCYVNNKSLITNFLTITELNIAKNAFKHFIDSSFGDCIPGFCGNELISDGEYIFLDKLNKNDYKADYNFKILRNKIKE